MNVGQLKKLLEGVPDDTVILVPAPDHSYREADPRPIEAVEPVEAQKGKRRRGWGEPTHYEWYGEMSHYDEPVKVVKALLVS